MYRERTKQDRHETPVGIRYSDDTDRTRHGSLSDTATLWDAHRTPENLYEAMMQPGDQPDAGSLIEAWSDYQTILDSSGMSPAERDVIDMMVFGGHSLAWTAQHMGCSKTWVAKLKTSALAKLREAYNATF
jgi:DNA-directed RNA polymerase specialized sigma24 family protein